MPKEAPMHPSVKSVSPVADYRLLLTFEDGQQRIFDMKPYLNSGVFASFCTF